jgi:hypothetical protein
MCVIRRYDTPGESGGHWLYSSAGVRTHLDDHSLLSVGGRNKVTLDDLVVRNQIPNPFSLTRSFLFGEHIPTLMIACHKVCYSYQCYEIEKQHWTILGLQWVNDDERLSGSAVVGTPCP